MGLFYYLTRVIVLLLAVVIAGVGAFSLMIMPSSDEDDQLVDIIDSEYVSLIESSSRLPVYEPRFLCVRRLFLPPLFFLPMPSCLLVLRELLREVSSSSEDVLDE